MSAGQNSGQAGARHSGADANLQSSADHRAAANPPGDPSLADNSAHVPPRRVTILRVAVAVLLLASAAFKVHAIFTEPYFADSILGSPVWMVGLVECEILLGLWLLSGVALRAAWLTALVAFAAFACSNLYLLAIGSTDCGCFGKVDTHPWKMLVLDVVILVLLSSTRPTSQKTDFDQTSAVGAVLLRSGIALAMCLSLLTVVLSIGAVRLGSLDAALASLRGESIGIAPSHINVGSAVQGTIKSYDVKLKNRLNRDVTIVGGSSTCKCIATQDLPTIVPANGEAVIAIEVHFDGEVGAFRQFFELLTNADGDRRILGRVSGSVVAE